MTHAFPTRRSSHLGPGRTLWRSLASSATCCQPARGIAPRGHGRVGARRQGKGSPMTYVAQGEFSRDQNYISTRITADGRDGFPVEAGRYRLVVSRACPLANRAIIVRRLLGLEGALSMGVAGPTHDARSWTFDLDPEI